MVEPLSDLQKAPGPTGLALRAKAQLETFLWSPTLTAKARRITQHNPTPLTRISRALSQMCCKLTHARASGAGLKQERPWPFHAGTSPLYAALVPAESSRLRGHSGQREGGRKGSAGRGGHSGAAGLAPIQQWHSLIKTEFSS